MKAMSISNRAFRFRKKSRRKSRKRTSFWHVWPSGKTCLPRPGTAFASTFTSMSAWPLIWTILKPQTATASGCIVPKFLLWPQTLCRMSTAKWAIIRNWWTVPGTSGWFSARWMSGRISFCPIGATPEKTTLPSAGAPFASRWIVGPFCASKCGLFSVRRPEKSSMLCFPWFLIWPSLKKLKKRWWLNLKRKSAVVPKFRPRWTSAWW